MHILLVEDDPSASRSVQAMLKGEGYKIRATALGEEAISLASHEEYDIIILDLTLPDMTGFQVLHSLRRDKVDTPVLVLSGDEKVESRVKALGLGADDYLLKPFRKEELLARLNAVNRRAHSFSRSSIQAGPITLNLDEKTVEANGSRVSLTVKEYNILETLTSRRGAVISKDTLLNQLYGGVDEPEPKIIDVFVCKLRKKLAAATGGGRYIRTVWGIGYQWHDQLSA